MTHTTRVVLFLLYLLALFNIERIERFCARVRERMRHE